MNSPPDDNLISASDFVLMHGNGKSTTDMQNMINTVKESSAYKSNPKPIVYNEDPNMDFSSSTNNFEVCIKNHVSWGFYNQVKFISNVHTYIYTLMIIFMLTHLGFK